MLIFKYREVLLIILLFDKIFTSNDIVFLFRNYQGTISGTSRSVEYISVRNIG